jgi:polyhydroxyalkanoate synthase
VSLSEVKVPLCAVACETDHIAHWKGSFNGVRQMGSTDKTFILSQSGHVAGIINPPSKGKYGHYTNPAAMGAAEDWYEGATFTQGSWWPRWRDWLAERSRPQIPAREPGDGPLPVLCAAPGTYVKAISAS